MKLPCRSILTAFAMSVAAHPAAAQVLEIAADGALVRYDGPTVFSDTGATAIPLPVLLATSRQAPRDVGEAIASAADRHGLDPALLSAVAWQESRFRQGAVSSKGAVGVMQLMPATARALGVDGADLTQNIHGGAAYLAQMLSRYNGDTALALAAYNAGPGAVDRYRGIPPYAETQNYVSAVLKRFVDQSGSPR